MHVTPDNRLKKLIVIGDRLLIKPTRPDERTASGLYLPPGVQEKEKVQQGFVIKTGPGYAIPMPVEEESWKSEEEKIKYVPLQVKEGDFLGQRCYGGNLRERKILYCSTERHSHAGKRRGSVNFSKQ
jgi:co-chaperonin GroES (HSP10)